MAVKHFHARMVLMMIVVVAVVGISRVATAAENPVRGGTAVIAISSDPGHFNPGITTGYNVHVVADSIFNGLVALDRTLMPVPDLATSWTINDDSTVYTFTLASGVQWHDGQPFTSADVKFTFEEVLFNYHSRTKAGLGSVVEAIETPNGRAQHRHAPVHTQSSRTACEC
ncbi:MAG: hypothetical protein ETSY1_23175 [Candidatus Entotheonella factor]|uniref:Solute-binding protein family 5 domain-containing protein n=1 Tax=Entotheonella factor TaxID=1429438 RepID=W4LJ18_ENTF1|nr:ABC transporter substrate-binding protein [Candidatus Entotheonella palauensis]ETW97316.1 MAG: hypothetical protein ETSY1_23175 [Candidatus Entotheonella factor]